jgi:hypothetical protein
VALTGHENWALINTSKRRNMAASAENPIFLVETVRALITKRRTDAWEKSKRGAGNLLERSHAEEENQTEEARPQEPTLEARNRSDRKPGPPTENKKHEPQIEREGRGNTVKQDVK